jgi:hypothetical protein
VSAPASDNDKHLAHGGLNFGHKMEVGMAIDIKPNVQDFERIYAEIGRRHL